MGYEGVIAGHTRTLMEAAAAAAHQTGAAILFHTERGHNIEALIPFFENCGVRPNRLYTWHVDKRSDVGLHRELAQAGALLGYDTCVRPKYKPEQGVWPLLRTLVADGLSDHIAIGLDLADASKWRYGSGLDLTFLKEQIVPRLKAEGFDDALIADLTGQNVARRLAWEKIGIS